MKVCTETNHVSGYGSPIDAAIHTCRECGHVACRVTAKEALACPCRCHDTYRFITKGHTT